MTKYMVDKEVIDGCIKKDRVAYARLYKTCAPYVYAVVKNYILDVDFRKDAMQEIFVQVFLSIHRFSPEKGDFKAWLSKIASNRCAVLLRTKITRVSFNQLPVDLESMKSYEMDQSLTRENIESILKDMPLGYRTIFLLSVIDGYSHKEISQLLEISPLTSRSQLSRATKWLKKQFSSQSKDFIYGIS